MALDKALISQFAKLVKNDAPAKRESTAYGTIVESNGKKYVQLDGSDILTPSLTTIDMDKGERVTVMIKNHMAIVTGNITSPGARQTTVDTLDEKVTEVDLQIRSEVSSSVTDLQGLIEQNKSAITQTADAIRLEVENISVGGANFLLGTVNPKTVTGNGTVNQAVVLYYLSDNFKVNKPVGSDVTLTFDWSTTATSGTMGPQWSSNPWHFGGPTVTFSSSNMSGHVELTFKYTQAMADGNAAYLRLRLDNVSGNITIKNCKLEKGNKATAWTPATEDPASAVLAGTTVEITKDKFRVEAETSEFAIPGSEDGEVLVRIDKDGLFAEKIECPTLVTTIPGGYYIVGSGGDFESLEAAFTYVNDKHLSGDMCLKLIDSTDPGGTLKGVVGSGKIFIMPINIMNTSQMSAWNSTSTTITQISSTDKAGGVCLEALYAGTYRMAV